MLIRLLLAARVTRVPTAVAAAAAAGARVGAEAAALAEVTAAAAALVEAAALVVTTSDHAPTSGLEFRLETVDLRPQSHESGGIGTGTLPLGARRMTECPGIGVVTRRRL